MNAISLKWKKMLLCFRKVDKTWMFVINLRWTIRVFSSNVVAPLLLKVYVPLEEIKT